MDNNLIDAAARFVRKPDPAEETLAHRDLVKRTRQRGFAKVGSNDNKPNAL